MELYPETPLNAKERRERFFLYFGRIRSPFLDALVPFLTGLWIFAYKKLGFEVVKIWCTIWEETHSANCVKPIQPIDCRRRWVDHLAEIGPRQARAVLSIIVWIFFC